MTNVAATNKITKRAITVNLSDHLQAEMPPFHNENVSETSETWRGTVAFNAGKNEFNNKIVFF